MEGDKDCRGVMYFGFDLKECGKVRNRRAGAIAPDVSSGASLIYILRFRLIEVAKIESYPGLGYNSTGG